MAAETVILKSYVGVPVQEEFTANESLYPGHLVEIRSDGKVQKHANSGQNVVPMFAIEDALQGKKISEAFSTGDLVRVRIPQRGDQINAVLQDSQNVSQGDFLESAGDGTLRKHTAGSAGVVEYPNAIVAQTTEDLDLSGSSGEESSGALGYDKRIAVRIV